MKKLELKSHSITSFSFSKEQKGLHSLVGEAESVRVELSLSTRSSKILSKEASICFRIDTFPSGTLFSLGVAPDNIPSHQTLC